MHVCETVRLVTSQTCDVELYLQRDLVGQGGVPQELVGLLQRPVLRGDPVDGQEAVPDLEQAAPVGESRGGDVREAGHSGTRARIETKL